VGTKELSSALMTQFHRIRRETENAAAEPTWRLNPILNDFECFGGWNFQREKLAVLSSAQVIEHFPSRPSPLSPRCAGQNLDWNLLRIEFYEVVWVMKSQL
jgi:hypothetical protein